MMHPLPFPRISAAAKATQQQLARHLSLHSSTVMLVFMSTDALCVSGSFTPGTNMKPSVVGPFPQSSITSRRHPAFQSEGDTWLKPLRQLQNPVAAALALHIPNAPHLP
jgi:hypothetical protein